MSVLIVLAGCSAVRSAREAQEATAEKADDNRVKWTVVPASGKGSPAVSYTIPEAVAYALTNRPTVVAAKLSVDDARLQLRQLAADAPLVSTTPWDAFSASATLGETQSSVGEHRGDFTGHTHGDPSASISVELLVWDFGRNAADCRAQAERVIAAEQTLVRESYAVFQEVANASFACREKQALLKSEEANEYAFRLHLEQAEGRLAQGESCNLDVLNARVEHAKSCESLLAASNEVETAFAELRHALGVPAEAICPEADLMAILSRETLRFDAERPVTLARTNSPSMRIARARLRAAQADVDRAVADLYPTVSASASLSWTDPLWYLSWGGKVVESLFEGFRRTTAVDRATVALKEAAANVDATEQDLMRSLELARATRDNSYEAERAARKTLAAAEENLSVVTRQYDVGEASRIDLTDALYSVAKAQGSVATAVCCAQQAEAELFVLTGTTPAYVK